MARVTVVGAGWAGLAAAVRLTQRGHQVTLLEAAPSLGGRARTVVHRGQPMDNGQHILIGAYRRTLALLHDTGVDVSRTLSRQPLALRQPDGQGLKLPLAPRAVDLLLGIATLRAWPRSARASMLAMAGRWALRRFQCAPHRTVRDLCAGMHPTAFDGLVRPLCLAALNTDPAQASGVVFLRVLRDALLGPRGSADLLLPRAPLGALLPQAAARWLEDRGASLRLRHRAMALTPCDAGWQVDDVRGDAVVLACAPREASRLAATVDPTWAERCAALAHEPIATVLLETESPVSLGAPMVMLPDGPAQFAFDLRAFGHAAADCNHRFTFVVSAATDGLAAGTTGIAEAVLAQARRHFEGLAADDGLRVVSSIVDKQATFRCEAGLRRPGSTIAEGLHAAGDHIDGPYPGTLEGAVLSGEASAAALDAWLRSR